MEQEKAQHVIKYIRSHNCVNYGVDGVYGGVVPTGNINMNFYSESASLPGEILLDIDPETGRVIKGSKRKQQQDDLSSSVREIVASVNVDLLTAKSLVIWLNNKIAELEGSAAV